MEERNVQERLSKFNLSTIQLFKYDRELIQALEKINVKIVDESGETMIVLPDADTYYLKKVVIDDVVYAKLDYFNME